MSEVTNTYQLPYPDLTDTPNVPSDMQALASAVDLALQPIDARARVPQIICGELAGNGNTGVRKISLPFSPQLVVIITQVVTPTASSGAVMSFNRGVLGMDVNGVTFQYNVGVRVTPNTMNTSSGPPHGQTNDQLSDAINNLITHLNASVLTFAERRITRSNCCGLMVDDSTMSGNGTGTILSDGFQINFLDNNSNNLSYFWEAHE